MSAAGSIPVWQAIGITPAPAGEAERFDVAVIGGGPVGLTLALDLGQRGHRVVLLNKLDFIAAGSKAICFAKRTLDIWDRLGVGQAMVDKGVIWNTGKVFSGDAKEPVYSFDLQPLRDQKRPAFINLQQYHAEAILVGVVEKLPTVAMRWGHEVVSLQPADDGVTLTIESGTDHYSLSADWVIACDGSRSPVRDMLCLDFDGQVFEDNFLIADIKLKEDRPAERWFWFDPPFNRGKSALLHKQPDNVWRLDFQLGPDVDRDECVRPENVAPFVEGMLGHGIDFTPEWYSVYTFQCRRMARFVHGRIVFAGDSAHLVSPFGARGCNGGVADADNLGWKLDLTLRREAPPDLIASYDAEAIVAADENILNSSRSTDFLTPKSRVGRAFRDAVLELASEQEFAQLLINSGRLSTAIGYPDSPLNTPDEADGAWAGVLPGKVAVDAPFGGGWLLGALGGAFSLVTLDSRFENVEGVRIIAVSASDTALTAIYDLNPRSAYLIRPDQYVAARWRDPSPEAISAAVRRAKGGIRWPC